MLKKAEGLFQVYGDLPAARASQTLQGPRGPLHQVRTVRPRRRRPRRKGAPGARRARDGPSSSPPTSRSSDRPTSSWASSSRPAPTSLPPAFLEALTRLQDKVEPFPFEEAEAIVTAELGVKISKAFATFEEKPIAAASLGQVHRATLRDGREVAVKVQRPDIRETIVKDLEALEEIAAFAESHTEVGKQYQFTRMVEEFHKSILRELDYRQEARNLTTLAQNLEEFDRIVVPSPIERLHDLAGAHHDLHPRPEDHVAQPAGADGAGRRRAGGAALPRLPEADPGGRLRPR